MLHQTLGVPDEPVPLDAVGADGSQIREKALVHAPPIPANPDHIDDDTQRLEALVSNKPL